MANDMFSMDDMIDRLDDAIERGDITEDEAREIYIEEYADFWRTVNDRWWGER